MTSEPPIAISHGVGSHKENPEDCLHWNTDAEMGDDGELMDVCIHCGQDVRDQYRPPHVIEYGGEVWVRINESIVERLKELGHYSGPFENCSEDRVHVNIQVFDGMKAYYVKVQELR